MEPNICKTIKMLVSASLTAVELVRAISAVVQPIAALRIAVASPISTRPLSTGWIICKIKNKNKRTHHDCSSEFYLKFVSLFNCIYVDVDSYCSCSHQNCPHSLLHGHICIWQGHTDPPDRWPGLSHRFDHLRQDHRCRFILRFSQLFEQIVHLPINVSLILTGIVSHTTSSFFIWAVRADLSITNTSQIYAFTTCHTFKFLWGTCWGCCHKQNYWSYIYIYI